MGKYSVWWLHKSNCLSKCMKRGWPPHFYRWFLRVRLLARLPALGACLRLRWRCGRSRAPPSPVQGASCAPCAARVHCIRALHVCTAFGRTHGSDAQHASVENQRRKNPGSLSILRGNCAREWLRWTVCLFADGTAVIMSRCLCAATPHTSRLMGRP